MENITFHMYLTYEKKNYNISKDFLIPRTILKQININQFNQILRYKVVIMGKNTFDELKTPLENRINIIFTSKQEGYLLKKFVNISNFYVVENLGQLESVLHKVNITKATVIGGIKMFNLFLPYVTRIYGKCLFKNQVSNIDSHFGDNVKANFQISDVSDFKYDSKEGVMFKEVCFTK